MRLRLVRRVMYQRWGLGSYGMLRAGRYGRRWRKALWGNGFGFLATRLRVLRVFALLGYRGMCGCGGAGKNCMCVVERF